MSAMRDLFASMEQAGGSFPPIMMLNVLHMCFPQFAQKNDQGVFQQQVFTSLCCVSVEHLVTDDDVCYFIISFLIVMWI